ncbi:MAG: TRAP transporter large permease subunit [Maricaulaceae bacterium]
MSLAESLDILMVLALCAALLSGFPVAFTLAGVALIFAGLGLALGVFDGGFLTALPQRIFGVMTNQVLVAAPLFIFMGVMLEKSKLAEDLLTTMGQLFGGLRGGLGVSVILVGALLAASTGIVGATVVTMGLLSLPTMLRWGYSPALASGAIAASGTLGQIIPPSIVLVLLGDVMSNAYQKSQLDQGLFAPETISVGDLYAGARIPGVLLVGLYIAFQLGVAALRPDLAPAAPETTGQRVGVKRVLAAIAPPLALIIAVLGSILGGVATPTEAAGVGALGAILLAAHRLAQDRPLTKISVRFGAGAILALLALTNLVDLRLGRTETPLLDQIAIVAAFALCAVAAFGVGAALWRLLQTGVLSEVSQSSLRITSMVFVILIGAAVFSLVFRGLGGDELVEAALANTPGGVTGAIIAVMVVVFLLGFFLDFIEITFVVVPLVAPPLLALGVDPIWLGVLFALNLQTSFLTPPFGFALFYLRGVAPDSLRTAQIYKGAIPFIGIQVFAIALVALWPALATALPRSLYG